MLFADEALTWLKVIKWEEAGEVDLLLSFQIHGHEATVSLIGVPERDVADMEPWCQVVRISAKQILNFVEIDEVSRL